MSLKEDAQKRILEIKESLDNEKIKTGILEEKTYNYEIDVPFNNYNFKVLVYFGKKGLKTVLQGNDNTKEYNIIRNLIFDETEFEFALNDIQEPNEYIGSDECGKGDFFGPLVVGAVFINDDTKQKLKNIGVKDSKDLNQNQISILSIKIEEIVGTNFQVVQINPSKYNQLYEQFNNLNKLLDWAHSKAIDNLLKNTGCNTVITDKFSNNELKVSFLSSHNNVEFIQSHKAERFTGVAAASIIARDAFNKWFKDNNINGTELPKGSSLQIEPAAKNIIDKYGLPKMENFAKLHFKTYKKLITNK